MDEKALKAKIDELAQRMFDMKELERQFDEKHAAEIKAINDLQKEVKDAVVDLGRTMETLKMKVEFRRGSTRWDTKFLEGYVLNHPELLRYKLEGRPTVAFKLKDEIPFETD